MGVAATTFAPDGLAGSRAVDEQVIDRKNPSMDWPGREGYGRQRSVTSAGGL
jgi:hypothetical protein